MDKYKRLGTIRRQYQSTSDLRTVKMNKFYTVRQLQFGFIRSSLSLYLDIKTDELNDLIDSVLFCLAGRCPSGGNREN